MNHLLWYRFSRWYQAAHPVYQWGVKIGGVLAVIFFVLIVTRTPSDRPKQTRIILDCREGCGSDPERTISYNEYMDRKEQQQRTWFREAKQQIQQNIWDERGRQRWCRNHPNDKNCKENK